MEPFVHLHNHFIFDSGMRVEDGVSRVAELGQPALALTDHGYLTLWPHFIEACRTAGIKPILGCELYFVEDAEYAIRQRLAGRYHLLVLARTAAGVKSLQNLIAASTARYAIDSRVALVDFKLLEQYSEGLIATSACVFGRVQDALRRGEDTVAENVLRRYLDIFGEHFYLEVASHFFPEQIIANRKTLALGKQFKVPVIAVNDCHFARQEDWYLQKVVMQTLFGELNNFSIESQECYLKSRREMARLGFPEAVLDETVTLAEKIDANAADGMRADGPAAAPGEPTFVPGRQCVIDAAGAVRAAGMVMQLPRTEREALASAVSGMSREELAAYDGYPDLRMKMVAPRLAGIVRGVEPDAAMVVSGRPGAAPTHSSGEIAYCHWTATELAELGFTVSAAGTDERRRAEHACRLLELERLYKSRAFDQLLDSALQVTDGADGVRDYYRALALARRRKPQEAEKIFLRLFDRWGPEHPRYFFLILQHAWNLFHLRRPFELVAQEFDRASEFAPANPMPYYAKGTLAYRQRKYGMAREALTKYCEVATPGKQYAAARDILDTLREP